MCNECGNCTAFCPYDAQPCKDKFTLFQTEKDFEDSENAGFLFLEDGKVRVRLAEVKDVTLGAGELPEGIEEFITTVKNNYSYLF
jgi:putative selenate reductase